MNMRKRSGMMEKEDEESREYAELEEIIKKRKPTFSENVIRYCDMREAEEEGLTDAMIYKEAYFNKDMFCKIKNNKEYRTSKRTVLAFAVVLHLDIEQAVDFLASAGFAFSDSIITDMIVKYYIEKKDYQCEKINDTLVHFKERPLFEIRGKMSIYD